MDDDKLQDRLWQQIIADLKADGLLDAQGRVTEKALGLRLPQPKKGPR